MSDTGRAAARNRVIAEMAQRRMAIGELALAAKVDKGTIGDFLSGARFPQPKTLSKIELALNLAPGLLTYLANGEETSDIGGLAVDLRGVDSQDEVVIVGPTADADDFVATGSGGTKRISNEEVLARLRRMREELEEIERGIKGGDA
ncbi:MAG: hypothetical protein JWM93_2430 [Frankiales bacterium]|nr:hypothetical protein [Frankiales bacterium]